MALIGRERERRQIEVVLAGRGTRALVIHGEAGIGKTVLWQEALDAAARRGMRVIATRPTEAEVKLPFVGLHDMLGSLVAELGDALPPPQKAALDVALMRASVVGEPVQPLAVSLGALELLRRAAEPAPVAVGIDDVGWLDDSSAGILRFVARRLDAAPVVFVASVRSDEPEPIPAIFADLPPERVSLVRVRPLSADDIDALLTRRANLELGPSAVRRVRRVAAGNPMHALEIGRLLAAGERSDTDAGGGLSDPLPALVRSRLDGLEADARDVIIHAAALGRPTSKLLAAALGAGRAGRGLAAARRADVLMPGDDPIRFIHPLLATEALASVDAGDLRAIHGRLADVVADREERAQHLALAATGPDPRIVAELEGAAALARDRGARDAAADLVELAASLCETSSPERARLTAAAGRDRLMAGDVGNARALLERALDEPLAGSGAARAELLFALAGVRQLMDDAVAAEALGNEALRHAGDDIALRVRILLLLAGVAFITERSWASGARHAAEARRLAKRSADETLRARTLGPDASWRYATGRRLSADLAREAASAARDARHLRTLDLPTYDLATIDLAEGRTERAYARFRDLAATAEQDGDYSSLPFLLANVALGDFLDGNPEAARSGLDRALHLATTTEQRTAQVHVHVHAARLAARLGRSEAAAVADRAFELMAATGWRIGEWLLRADLAAHELGLGDPAAALAYVRDATEPDLRGRSARWRAGLGVAVEALIALGRLERAGDLLDADIAPRPTGRLAADLLRARARLLAAQGDQDGADAAITAALDAHRTMGDRWETSRTQLLAGEIHRRARRRALARAAIRDALEGFLFLGAAVWADVARSQLARGDAGHADGGLTSTQRMVATLAAEGLRNRQIAGRLGMSPHTVEAHLSAVYRALGIQRRSQLRAALSGEVEMRDSDDVFGDPASS